jgi:UDP-N-acetylmuramate dehydrogenase
MSLAAGLEHIVREQEPLAGYTWFRLGGPAQFFAEPTTADELATLVKRARAEEMPVRILGGGSNVLVRDEGVPGLVIHLTSPAFCEVLVRGQAIVAGAGAKLGHVLAIAAREGLAGLEQLAGIPGTVGGALRGNSSTANADIGQWTRAATVLTHAGELAERRKEELRFGYLESSLDDLVILRAGFHLERESPEELTRRMQRVWIVKKAQQPGSDSTTGCIFKDAAGVPAAELIEAAGLKGHRLASAMVSERHANFILTEAGATAAQVRELIALVQGQVEERMGVKLETAIQVW